MTSDDEIKQLLIEIRDLQQEQLDVSREQLERAKRQVTESIELQKTAMARFQAISKLAIPMLILCLGLIVYLVVRFFV